MEFSVKLNETSQAILSTVPSQLFIAVGVYLTMVTFASVSLNGLASYVILAKFRFATAQTQILFSMFLGDALVSAIAYPLAIYANFKRYWNLGSQACSYYSFVTSIGGIGSIYHLVLLSGERFLSIVYPFDYPNIIRSKNVIIAALVSWLLSVVTSFLPLVGWSSYVKEGIGTSCAFDLFPTTWSSRSFNLYLIFIAFILPMVCIVYFNIAFLGVVFKLVRCPCNKDASGNTTQHNPVCQVRQDRRLANQMSVLVTILIFCFLFSWFPYAVVTVIGIFGKLPHNNPVAISMPSFFAKSYTIYDPMVYFFLDKKLRKAVKTIFCKGQIVSTGNDIEMPPSVHQTPTFVIRNERMAENRNEQVEDVGQDSIGSEKVSFNTILAMNAN